MIPSSEAHRVALVLSDPLQPYERSIIAHALIESGLHPPHPSWTTEIAPRHTPINTIGGGTKPGKRAMKKHRPALLRWLEIVQPRVLVIAGGEALESLCGLRPVSAYRRKLVRGPLDVAPLVEWVVPMYDMDTIRRTGFKWSPYLKADFKRAARAASGELRLVTL